MYKTVCLLKRKPGMSFEDFVDYYESHHRKLGEKWVQNRIRYVRRYLRPIVYSIGVATPEPEYDVLTEMWFDTREDFDLAMAALLAPEPSREITTDEENLFDRSKICLCSVEEHESPPPAGAGH